MSSGRKRLEVFLMRRMKLIGAWLALMAVAVAAFAFGGIGAELLFSPSDAQAQAGEVEQQLRISAQRLENGRMQFGLRVPDGAGGWEDPVQPRVNWFAPSSRNANRWLSSSALTLARVGDTGNLSRSEDFSSVSIMSADVQITAETWEANTRYSAEADQQGGLITSVSLYSPASGTIDGELRTDITCNDGELSLRLAGLAESGDDEDRTVSWSTDGGPEQSEQWDRSLVAPAGSGLIEALLGSGTSLALSVNGEITSELDLRALQAAAVYDHLTECGVAPTVQAGSTEVRIQAYLRQDGSDTSRALVEFALQQRRADGSWGERILPTSRLMPAYGAPSNWASSTPISVTLAVGTVTRDVRVVGDPDPAGEPLSPRLGAGGASGGVEFEAMLDAETNAVNSWLRQHSNGPLVLEVSCVEGERSVALSGIPEEAGGSLAFNLDGEQSLVRWANGAFDAERVIRRLGGALSLTIGAGTTAESSFDVSHLLASPIQRNIDQCGQLFGPAVNDYVPWAGASQPGTVTYGTGLPDPETGLIRTSIVSTRSTAEAVISLNLSCVSSPLIWFGVSGLPLIETGQTEVTMAIGGREPVRSEWFALPGRTDSQGNALSSRVSMFPDPATVAQLMIADSITIEAHDTDLGPITIPLAGLFSSPLQENINHCAFTAPGDDLNVRVAYRIHADGRLEVGLQEQSADGSWGELQLPRGRTLLAGQLADKWLTSSAVTIGSFATPFEAQVAVRRLPDGSVELAVQKRVNRRDWSEPLVLEDRFVVADAEVDRWYETAPVSVGRHPGPTRALPSQDPPVAAEDSEGEAAADAFVTSGSYEANGRSYSWSRAYSLLGGATVGVSANPLDTQNLYLIFRLACSDTGPSAFLYLTPALGEDQASLPVTWQVDEGEAYTEQWNVRTLRSTAFNASYIAPTSGRAFYAQIRHGTELSLSFEGHSPVRQDYELMHIFGTPIQQSLDECAATEVPLVEVPVQSGSVLDGLLRYNTGAFGGEDVSTTNVVLRIPDDRAPSWAGYSSFLQVSCFGDRPGIGMYGIGLVEGRVIDGESVEVTWHADNGSPRTEMWDAWLSGAAYLVSPPDDLAVFNAIKGAETFTLTVSSSPEFTQTYELAANGFWETPVQPNLDICGGELSN